MIYQSSLTFPNKFFKCVDISKREAFEEAVYGLLRGDEDVDLAALEKGLLGHRMTYVKEGMIVGSYHMLQPEEIDTIEDVVLHMSVVTEDGEIRAADELDVQLLLGLASFINIPLDVIIPPEDEESVYDFDETFI